MITKLLAIILTLGFGGGVFSPSLFLGEMVGGAFGIIVISLETMFGLESSNNTLIIL